MNLRLLLSLPTSPYLDGEQELIASPTSMQELIEASGPSKFASDKAIAEVTLSKDYLPYLVLYGANSNEVKHKKISMGHFGLRMSKSNIIDLTDEVVLLVVSWRPKAMIYTSPPIAYFDPDSQDFKDVQATANDKNSKKGYGPEFLIWIPEVQKFGTYFLGSKTGRNEAPNILGPLKDSGPFACKQRAKLIETPEFSWHGPETLPHDLDVAMPSQELLVEQLTKFNNPPAATQEAQEKDESDSDRE